MRMPFKRKRDFANYCADRQKRSDFPAPALLDWFTEGNSVCLVESAPKLGWSSLQNGPPPSPTAWTLAFFKGLDAIGAVGNPSVAALFWRNSEVLFSRSTFPAFDSSDAASDNPDWIRRVIQSAFEQESITAILDRDDLVPDLRSRLLLLQTQGQPTPPRNEAPVVPATSSAPPTPTPTPPPLPITKPQPSKRISREGETARDFLRAFDNCCKALSLQDHLLQPAFAGQRSLLEQQLHELLSIDGEDQLHAWMSVWRRLSYQSCALLADWMDDHPDPQTIKPNVQSNAYRNLIGLAGLGEIQPRPNDTFIPSEHRQVGTLAPATAADYPGSVAHARNRGFRRGDEILRKAAVQIFDRQMPAASVPQKITPTRFPYPLAMAVFVVLLLSIVLAAWFYNRVSSGPGPRAENIGPRLSATPSPSPTPSPQRVETAGQVRIKQFVVDPRTIQVGQAVNLRWEVEYPKNVRITGLGPTPLVVPASGERNVVPLPDTQQIVLEAEGDGANNTASAARPLRFLAPSITEFSSDPNPVAYGDAFTLSWTVAGATNLQIDRPGLDQLPVQGTKKIQTQGSSEYLVTYTLTADSPAGPASAQIVQRVIPKIVDFSFCRARYGTMRSL
jgi:hypothetical protein